MESQAGWLMAIAMVHEGLQERDGHRGLIAWVHAAMPIIEAVGDTSMMGKCGLRQIAPGLRLGRLDRVDG
jgi:hypothetical protein